MIRSEGMPTFKRGLEGFGHLFVQFDVKFPLNMNLLEDINVPRLDPKIKLTKEQEQKRQEEARQRYEDRLLVLSRFFKQKSVPLFSKKTPRQELEAEIARVERELKPMKEYLEKIKTKEAENLETLDALAKARKDGKSVMDVDLLDTTVDKEVFGDDAVKYDPVPDTQMPPPPSIAPEQISYGDLVIPEKRRAQGVTTEDDEEESAGHGGPGGVQCASQ